MHSSAKIRKDEDRKSRRAARSFRRWLEDLRRRQMQQERDRLRKWLLALLLLIFDSKPRQPVFSVPAHDPASSPPRPSEKDRVAQGKDSKIRRNARPEIPGLPERYCGEWPELWTVLEHLKMRFAKDDAVVVLKQMTPADIHEWLLESISFDGGKAIQYCKRDTTPATIAEMRRAAIRWQEDRIQREREATNALQNGPKTPDDDQGNPKV